jgi:hypothetical protein
MAGHPTNELSLFAHSSWKIIVQTNVCKLVFAACTIVRDWSPSAFDKPVGLREFLQNSRPYSKQAELARHAEAHSLRHRRLQCLAGCGKTRRSVILSEAKNLSFFYFVVLTIEERFFASLRMTK